MQLPKTLYDRITLYNVCYTKLLRPEDMKKMTPPDSVPQAIRRVQTRIFTAYRAGVK